MVTLPTTSNVTRPQMHGYGALLGDLYLRLAVGPDRRLEIATAPLQAQRVNTAENPEDFVQEFGATFSRADFTGGEGLDRAHRRNGTDQDPARFWDSRGIDIVPAQAGQTGRVRLAHDTETLDAQAASDLYAVEVGGTVYMTAGTTLRVSSNPTAAVPTWANEDPHAGSPATAATGIANLGGDLYAALNGNGIHRKPSGGAWAHWNDLQAERVWAVKNRIVASLDDSLYEVDAAGAAPTPLKTIGPGLEWTDVADAGAFILATATDGYVYAFTVNADGVLELVAQTWLEGETPYTVGAAFGQVFYGTAEQTGTTAYVGRLYRATLGGDGVLAGIELLRQWGDPDTQTLDQRPREIVTTRDSVYVTVPDDGSETHLWRVYLPSGGLWRALVFDGGGAGRSIFTVGGRLWVTIDGEGIARETGTFVPEGWLIGPVVDLFSASEKSWSTLRVSATLTTSHTVGAAYSTDVDDLADADSAGWQNALTLTGPSATQEAPLEQVKSRELAVRLKLSTADTSSSPTLSSYTLLALPGDAEVMVRVPVNVSDQVEAPGRHRTRVPGLGEAVYQQLKVLEGEPAVLELFRPSEVLRGTVLEVATPVTSISRRGSVTSWSLVTFRGRRLVSGSSSTSGAGLGVGLLGVMRLGGAEVT